MAKKILIVQSDPKAAQTVMSFFAARGDQVQQVSDLSAAEASLEQHQLDLIVVDLHLLGNNGQSVQQESERWFNGTKVLFTTSYPDPERELQAKTFGAKTFLRQPFTRNKLEAVLQGLDEELLESSADSNLSAKLPKVRIPMRVKIVFPYIVLSLILALAAAYLISQVMLETIEDRFTNQVIEMGKVTADWMVQEETDLLQTLRLLANTQDLPQAIVAEDAEKLRELALPIAVNYGEESIEILSKQGVSLLSMRHRPEDNREVYIFSRGEDGFVEWDFVQRVLTQQTDQTGDKYGGVVQATWGDYFYVAGPIYDADGQQVGLILVGKSLQTLVRQIRQDTLAHTTIYDFTGQPIISTLPAFQQGLTGLEADQVDQVMTRQDTESLIRPVTVASIAYSEILAPWEVRGGDDIGLIGASLAQTFLVRPSQARLLQIFLLVTVAFFCVITMGLYLSRRITQPLLHMVQASGQVAQGDLEVKVDPAGNDEVAVLAHSFNHMVSGLREGSIYRDLLGRTVSPEVREQLRQTFAAGDLRLEGQNAQATVLMTDVREFTSIAEKEDPTTILTWLNDYFGELVPIITAHSGVVNKFDGDAILAFFGILPRLLPPQESAYLACCVAVQMLKSIDQANARRLAQGVPPFKMGIGINTGLVTAGGLGAADRLQYTIIGDTVNTTQRLESYTKVFAESGAVVSHHTVEALGERCREFQLESLGLQSFKGKSEQLEIYRLWPANAIGS